MDDDTDSIQFPNRRPASQNKPSVQGGFLLLSKEKKSGFLDSGWIQVFVIVRDRTVEIHRKQDVSFEGGAFETEHNPLHSLNLDEYQVKLFDQSKRMLQLDCIGRFKPYRFLAQNEAERGFWQVMFSAPPEDRKEYMRKMKESGNIEGLGRGISKKKRERDRTRRKEPDKTSATLEKRVSDLVAQRQKEREERRQARTSGGGSSSDAASEGTDGYESGYRSKDDNEGAKTSDGDDNSNQKQKIADEATTFQEQSPQEEPAQEIEEKQIEKVEQKPVDLSILSEFEIRAEEPAERSVTSYVVTLRTKKPLIPGTRIRLTFPPAFTTIGSGVVKVFGQGLGEASVTKIGISADDTRTVIALFENAPTIVDEPIVIVIEEVVIPTLDVDLSAGLLVTICNAQEQVLEIRESIPFPTVEKCLACRAHERNIMADTLEMKSLRDELKRMHASLNEPPLPPPPVKKVLTFNKSVSVSIPCEKCEEFNSRPSAPTKECGVQFSRKCTTCELFRLEYVKTKASHTALLTENVALDGALLKQYNAVGEFQNFDVIQKQLGDMKQRVVWIESKRNQARKVANASKPVDESPPVSVLKLQAEIDRVKEQADDAERQAENTRMQYERNGTLVVATSSTPYHDKRMSFFLEGELEKKKKLEQSIKILEKRIELLDTKHRQSLRKWVKDYDVASGLVSHRLGEYKLQLELERERAHFLGSANSDMSDHVWSSSCQLESNTATLSTYSAEGLEFHINRERKRGFDLMWEHKELQSELSRLVSIMDTPPALTSLNPPMARDAARHNLLKQQLTQLDIQKRDEMLALSQEKHDQSQRFEAILNKLVKSKEQLENQTNISMDLEHRLNLAMGRVATETDRRAWNLVGTYNLQQSLNRIVHKHEN